jgi:hypothetical protein
MHEGKPWDVFSFADGGCVAPAQNEEQQKLKRRMVRHAVDRRMRDLTGDKIDGNNGGKRRTRCEPGGNP